MVHVVGEGRGVVMDGLDPWVWWVESCIGREYSAQPGPVQFRLAEERIGEAYVSRLQWTMLLVRLVCLLWFSSFTPQLNSRVDLLF